MTTGTITPYRSAVPAGHDGFAQLLHAEWTKFRTVRGWVIGMVVAALLPAGLMLLVRSSCGSISPNGKSVACSAPLGPGGEAVTDHFYFVHRPVATDSSITVRVASLTGAYSTGAVQPGQGQAGLKPGLQPWAKAGIVMKANTRQGSAYVAMLVTGSHGVRMQYDYTRDTAGLAGAVSAASPRWLRLVRHGGTFTGYDSADGTHWTLVGSATLAGLPPAIQGGLFATSPAYTQPPRQTLTGRSSTGGPGVATARIDHLSLQGGWPASTWTGDDVGNMGDTGLGIGFRQAGGTYTVTGTGDIAPDVPAVAADTGMAVERTLTGMFAALIAITVIGTVFMTAEYRRGLIRLTLSASPRRGRALAAKAVVIGAVTFVAGLAAAAIVIPLGEHVLRAGGNFILPVTPLTEIRLIVGTAALLAVTAVFALATGALLRRSAGAVTAVIVAIVLAYLLAVSVLPPGAAGWVLRLTPAAAFAVQQTVVPYPQVSANYTPQNGYFPLAPWAGLAVLCCYAALALGLAVVAMRRRDA